MGLLERGEQKHREAQILTASATRGWAGLAADLRRHQPCELPTVRLQRMEACGPLGSYRLACSLDDRRLRRVLDFMAAHLEEDIGLDELASAACLSPFHFSRLFRNRTGVPPCRYLSQLRLDLAKSLLAAGEQPLSEIALRCGFSSQCSFNKAFLKSAGMTPGAFRITST